MKEWLKKFWHELTVKIVVALVLAALGLCVAVFNEKARDAVWNFLAATIHVPRWIFIPLLGFVIHGMVVFICWVKRPSYVKNFREVDLDGMSWRWSYDRNKPLNLTAYCLQPKANGRRCGVRLKPHTAESHPAHPQGGAGTTFHCPGCNHVHFIWGSTDVPDLELRKVENLIETGEWKHMATNEATGPVTSPSSSPAQVSTFMPAPKVSEIEKEPDKKRGSIISRADRALSQALGRKVLDNASETKGSKAKRPPRRYTIEALLPKVENAIPHLREGIEKDLVGSAIEGIYRLEGVSKASGILTIYLEGKGLGLISCVALDENDRTLLIANKGDKVRVRGVLKELSMAFCRLDACDFELIAD